MNFKDMAELSKEEKDNIRENIRIVSLILFKNKITNDENKPDFYDEEYHDASFIYKVLSGKLKAFNIDVQVQDGLYMVIDVCSQGNPLYAQLLLFDVLNNISNLKPGRIITCEDFANTFPAYCPLLLYPNVKKEFEKRAIELKLENDGYPVDCKEFWNQIWG